MGITAGVARYDADAIIERMAKDYDELYARFVQSRNQCIEFPAGKPIAIVNFADLHLGKDTINIRRLFHEARTAVETPGMWIGTIGDLVHNMVLPKLMHARLKASEVTPEKEWFILREFIQLIAPKLLYSVGGNHDTDWVTTLTGLDFFADVLRQLRPQALYATDVRFVLKVGTAEYPHRVRHRWRLRSMYSASHGIEQAARFDGDFLVGIAAHWHDGSLYRSFINRGKRHVALICGTYDTMDVYSQSVGFPMNDSSTAITAVYDDDGSIIPFDRIEKAAEYLRMFYQ